MALPTRLSISPPLRPTSPTPIFTEVSRVAGGSTSTPVTVGDANVDRFTDGKTINEWDVSFGSGDAGSEFDLLLGVCTNAWPTPPAAAPCNFRISGSRIESLAAGDGTLAIYDYGSKTSQLYSFSARYSTPTTSDAFVDWDAGSAAEAATGWADANESLIQENLWTTYDPATNTFVYNNSSLNGSTGGACQALVAWNSDTNGRQKGGVLITPEHVAYTQHYKPSVGSTVKFVETDGTVHQRTIQEVISVVGGFDAVVARLSEPVTAIQPMKVISPADLSTKFPSVFSGQMVNAVIPCFVIDQQRRVRTLLWKSAKLAAAYDLITADSAYSAYSHKAPIAIAGDSGSPVLLGIDDTLAFLSHTTFPSWSGGGPSLGGDYDSILAARGRSLSYLDLSSYNTY